MTDWVGWHCDYDDPSTRLAQRLRAVQGQVADALDRAQPGPLRVVSMCAGKWRDLLGVLAGHPRRDDVRARLVELDPRNASLASAAAEPPDWSGWRWWSTTPRRRRPTTALFVDPASSPGDQPEG